MKSMRMRRGVGFCHNADCDEFLKGVFLLNHPPNFYCPRCRKIGSVTNERGSTSGIGSTYREVRVEFYYDPAEERYRNVAIVRDESVPLGLTYTFESPLIKAEKRALKVAESMLANLSLYKGHAGEIPATVETSLDLSASKKEFSKALERIASQWEKMSK